MERRAMSPPSTHLYLEIIQIVMTHGKATLLMGLD
jgi:hypothetical protein